MDPSDPSAPSPHTVEAFRCFLTILEVPPEEKSVQKLNQALLDLLLSDTLTSGNSQSTLPIVTPDHTLRQSLYSQLIDGQYHHTGHYASFFQIASTSCENTWKWLLTQLQLDTRLLPPQLHLAWLAVKDYVMDRIFEMALGSLHTHFRGEEPRDTSDFRPILESGAA